MPACARSGRTSIAYLDGALGQESEGGKERGREGGGEREFGFLAFDFAL